MSYRNALNPDDLTINELQLDDISFEWIQKTKKIQHLVKARRLIEEDGNYFQELKKAVEERIVEQDPKRSFNKDVFQYISPEDQLEAKEDLFKFLGEMSEKENKKKQSQNNEIFEEAKNESKNGSLHTNIYLPVLDLISLFDFKNFYNFLKLANFLKIPS